jgi:predicted O-methyltransferase YrrM
VSASPNGLGRVIRRLTLDPVLRRYGHPTMGCLLGVGGRIHADPEAALRALLDIPALPAGTWPDFDDRWEVFRRRLACHPGWRVQPDYYDIEPRTAQFLYGLVRAVRPSTVVETGVANGVSSYVLASALVDNGDGRLYSIDVHPDVAPFLAEEEQRVWRLILLPSRGRRRGLRRVLDALGPIDVFFHDSHHTYRWQMAEYEAATARMRPGGILASDDVDASFAFSTFCERRGRRAEFVFDSRKVCGASANPAP